MPSVSPAVHAVAVVARRGLVMSRVATVAGMSTLLHRVVERPGGTDGMAGIAGGNIPARHMARRPLRCVAGQAGSGRDSDVTVRSRQPGRRDVATVTCQQCLRTGVICRLAYRRRAVMACRTRVRSDPDMPVGCRRPVQSAMALIARQRRTQSGMDWRHTCGGPTVVAVRARAGGNRGVVVESREPGDEPVARIAAGCGFQHRGMAGRFGRGQSAVVALNATGSGHDARVIKAGRNPGMRFVAPFA